MSSHLLAEVAQTADRVVVIDHGRLVTHSSLADLMADAHQVVRVRTHRAEELRVALLAEGAQVTLDWDRLEVTGASAERIGLVAAQLRADRPGGGHRVGQGGHQRHEHPCTVQR